MCLCIEGAAFAYVFNAWNRQKDNRLLWLAIISGITFVLVLSPFVASQAKKNPEMSSILTSDIMLWVWSIAVSASTIVIVASVGYSQGYVEKLENSNEKLKSTQEIKILKLKQEPEILKLNQEVENSNLKTSNSTLSDISDRQSKIIQEVRKGNFNISKFAEKENTSPQTIYNDLRFLSKANLIFKNGKGWESND